jgi:hypothetical protein
MNTYEFDPSILRAGSQADAVEPFIEICGSEGSTLRATRESLTVLSRGASASAGDADRRWAYQQLGEVRLDAYGPVGVIRATVESTGGVLPLLLLEPEQISAARRTLEIIWNLMASVKDERRTA